MKDNFKYLQLLGQSLMLPVSVLPAAGLLFRFGEKDLLNMPAVREAGLAVFANLPLIFAVGVAIGFSGGQPVAALAAVVGQIILLAVLKALSPSLDMGVFSGITMGIVAAVLYRHFYQIKLPHILGFFGGKRFVPILTAVAGVVIALISEFVWPELQKIIDILGHAAVNSSMGPALFAAGKRLLIPVGLHHVYYPSFLYEFGHYTTATGQLIKGDFHRYFAGDPTAGVFMASEFPIMMFGLPAAAFALYYNARPERRKSIAGLMLSGALTSFLTGITEPVEFAFIFAAPQLFIFHVFMAGVSGWFTSLFDVHLGFTFSASFIDYLLAYKYGQNQLLIWPIGIAIGLLYFIVFHFAINVLDLKTPGREADGSSKVEITTIAELADKVIEALGGSQNIEALDACISRLRVTVKRKELTETNMFPTLGATGVMEMGRSLQIIFGTQSDHLKEEIMRRMGNPLPAIVAMEYQSAYTQSEDTYVRIKAPVSGRIIPLEELTDPKIEELNGNGIAIQTSDSVCVSPAAGKILQLLPDEHTIVIALEDPPDMTVCVKLHLTVPIDRCYTALVTEGQYVTIGQEILTFDWQFGQEKELSGIVVVFIPGIQELEITPVDEVTAYEDTILQFDRNRS